MQAKIIPINEKEPSRHFLLESEQAKQTFRKEKHSNFFIIKPNSSQLIQVSLQWQHSFVEDNSQGKTVRCVNELLFSFFHSLKKKKKGNCTASAVICRSLMYLTQCPHSRITGKFRPEAAYLLSKPWMLQRYDRNLWYNTSQFFCKSNPCEFSILKIQFLTNQWQLAVAHLNQKTHATTSGYFCWRYQELKTQRGWI